MVILVLKIRIYNKILEKQSFADVLQNRYSQKFRNFDKKIPVLESLFNKVAATLLKRYSNTGVFLSNLRNDIDTTSDTTTNSQTYTSCFSLCVFIKNQLSLDNVYRSIFKSSLFEEIHRIKHKSTLSLSKINLKFI